MKIEIDDEIFNDLVKEAKEEDLTVEELANNILSLYLYEDEEGDEEKDTEG